MRRIMSLIAVLLVFFAVGVNFAQTLSAAESQPQEPTAALDAILNLAKEFEGFKVQLNSMDSRLIALQKSIVEKSSSCGIQCCVKHIIESIRTSNYKVAEQELIELNNVDLIPSIVNDVYAGSSRYLDILLDFVKSLKIAETRLHFCSALLDAMRTHFNTDPLKLIVLAREIQNALPRLGYDDAKQRTDAVLGEVVKEIKTISALSLEAILIVNQFQDNDEVETLATALFDFRSDVANEVIEGFVEKVFGVFAAEVILDNISSCQHIPFVIAGLAAVYNRSNLTGKLDSKTILSLASNLYKLQEREDYSSVSTKQKNDVKELMHQLPACVINLFFHKNVRLWNEGKQKYLCAVDNSFKLKNRGERLVYLTSSRDPAASWIVEKNGTDFFFKNVEYENEYLQPTSAFNNDLRNVGTRTPDNNGIDQMAWSVEVDGVTCLLKNVFRNERLFAPVFKLYYTNYNVFTSLTFATGPRSMYEWEVRNCDL